LGQAPSNEKRAFKTRGRKGGRQLEKRSHFLPKGGGPKRASAPLGGKGTFQIFRSLLSVPIEEKRYDITTMGGVSLKRGKKNE